MIRRHYLKNTCITLVILALAGCSSAQKSRFPGNPDPVIKGEVNKDTVGLALKMKLEKQLDYLEENKEKFEKQVMSIRSGETQYHYKYYEEFPEGPEGLDIDVTPLETLSPAFKGEAKYRKIRYQTRYSKSGSRAADDTDFIRDEGVQEETYEFDGTKWQLKSSIFEVRKTSVYDEKGWRVTQGRLRRAEEDEPELFVDKVRSLFGLLD